MQRQWQRPFRSNLLGLSQYVEKPKNALTVKTRDGTKHNLTTESYGPAYSRVGDQLSNERHVVAASTALPTTQQHRRCTSSATRIFTTVTLIVVAGGTVVGHPNTRNT